MPNIDRLAARSVAFDKLCDLQQNPTESQNLINERPEVAAELAVRHGRVYETGRSARGIMAEYETSGTATHGAGAKLASHDDGTGSG